MTSSDGACTNNFFFLACLDVGLVNVILLALYIRHQT